MVADDGEFFLETSELVWEETEKKLTLGGSGHQQLRFRGDPIAGALQEARGEQPFANPRNSTSGALKLLDPKLCAERRLRFFAHGIGTHDDGVFTTHIEYLEARADTLRTKGSTDVAVVSRAGAGRT